MVSMALVVLVVANAAKHTGGELTMFLRKSSRAHRGALAKGARKAGAGAARRGIRIRIGVRAGGAGGRKAGAGTARRGVRVLIKMRRGQRQKRS
jgi:hypothetical protein